uniref:PHB domain-containing protein n=1 Tax=Gongylonema pulchrum TaxID=637853 RepID=A0A183CYP2_9BILA
LQTGPRYSKYSYTATDTESTEAESPALHAAAVENIFVGLCFLLFLMTLPLSLLFSLKFVSDFERLVVLRLGRAQKTRGPGATVVLPCIDTYTKVDLRVNAFNVPPMQIITIDRGIVELGATVFLKVKDALAAVCAVKERNQSTRTLAVATLHRLACKQRAADLASTTGRMQLSNGLQVELDALTGAWGVEITKVEVSEVKVIKEGENIALATFNKVLKSELGSKIIETITNTAQEFVLQQQREQEERSETDKEEGTVNLSGGELHKNVGQERVSDDCLKDFDIDRLLCSLAMVIDERLVAAVGHIFQVNCTDFGDFYVDLKNGSGDCCKGANPMADVTFCLNRALLSEIITKRVTPMQAYLNGSLRIRGSFKIAIKLALLSDRLNCLL